MATNTETRRIEIITAGTQTTASINQMRQAARLLYNELQNLPKGSEAFKNSMKSWQEVDARLKNATSELRNVGAAMKDAGNTGSGFFSTMKFGMVGMLGANLMTNFLGTLNRLTFGVIQNSAKMSDQMADIARVTGMTTEQVQELNSALGDLNTRTSTSALREMAVVAGQMGVSQDQLRGFVENMDKINVVMGGEFGGDAEKVASEIGRLRNLFADIKTEDIGTDILHIGNAMNILAQNGMATAPVVADFAARIGGVGISLGLTTGQVLGLSATLQELNVNTERGGTAVTRILQYMSKRVEVFAKVAGMGVKEFSTLVNTDMFGAFTRVIEGAGKSAAAATTLASTLDELGVDGAGASEVIAKLSKNQDMLGGKVRLATEGLKGQSSIMEQFEQKNNTLGANLEKLGKKIASVWAESGMTIGLNALVGALVSTETASDKAAAAYNNMKLKVMQLEENIVPLLDRHDELKSKTNLNKNEQKELADIIKKVGDAIPGSIREFDKYGKALAINSQSARQFVNNQILALRSLNRDAIKEMEDELKEKEKRAADLLGLLKRTSRESDEEYINRMRTGGRSGAQFLSDAKLLEERATHISWQREILGPLQQEIDEDYARLRQLRGDDLVDMRDATEKANAAAEEQKKKAAAMAAAGNIEPVTGGGTQKDKRKAREDEAREQERALQEEFRNTLQYLESWQNVQEVVTKEQYLRGEITYEQYQAKLAELQLQYLYIQKTAYQDYGHDDSRISKEIADERIRQMERSAEVNRKVAKEAEEAAADALKFEKHILGPAGPTSQAGDKPKNDWTGALQLTLDIYQGIIDLQKVREDNALQSEKRITDNRLNALQRQKDAGLITEKEYQKQSEEIQNEYDEKRRKVLQDQWKRQRDANTVNAIINTAVAGTKALAEGGPIAGPILAALTAAAGAIQVGTIQSQAVPEFEHGGSSVSVLGRSGRRYNAKRGRAAGYYDRPTYIVGEKQGELIVPGWLYNHPRAVNIMGALEAAISQRSIDALGGAGAGAEMGAAVQKLNATLERGIIATVPWDEVGHKRYMDRWKMAEQLSAF